MEHRKWNAELSLDFIFKNRKFQFMKILQKIYPLSLKTKNTIQKQEKKHEEHIVNEVLKQKRTLGNLKDKVWTLVYSESIGHIIKNSQWPQIYRLWAGEKSLSLRPLCTSRGPTLSSLHPCHLTHSCLQLPFQGIWRPLSSVNRWIHMVSPKLTQSYSWAHNIK